MAALVNDDNAHVDIVKSIKGRKKVMLESKKLYTDDEFPADSRIDDRQIVWKRIKEIDDKASLYFDGNPIKGKIELGTFGSPNVNAVFLAISNHQRLLRFVFPPDQNFDSPHYCGLFYFRFWKMGNWVYVVVDDRVPVVAPEKEKKKIDKGKLLMDSSSSKKNSKEVTETADEYKTREKTEAHQLENYESKTKVGDTNESKSLTNLKSQKQNEPRKSGTICPNKPDDVSEGGDGPKEVEETNYEQENFPQNNEDHAVMKEDNNKKPNNVKESGEKQLYSLTVDKEGNRCYWTTLLEKAYAKLCGGYDKLSNVVLIDVLQDLTGGVIETYDSHYLPPNFFLELKSYSDKQCIVIASTNHEVEQEENSSTTNFIAVTQVLFADFRKLLGREKMLGLVRMKTNSYLPGWNKKWIEASKDWEIIPVLVQRKLKMEARDENEFYLTYKNFLATLSALHISSTADGRNYNCEGHFSNWSKPHFQYNITQTDELKFHEFHQHKIWIRDPNDLNFNLSVEGFLSLTRDGICSCSGNVQPCSAMQIYLFSLDRGVDIPVKFNFFRFSSPVGCSELSTNKNLTVRFSLHPGYYLVVPTLIHVSWSRPNEPQPYLLRVVMPSYVKSINEPENVLFLSEGCVSQNTNFDLSEVTQEKEEVAKSEKMSGTNSKQGEDKAKEKGKKKR